MEIRSGKASDNEAIREIFNFEVENGVGVLELRERSVAEQAKWMEEHSTIYSVIVAEAGQDIWGFASISPYRIRPGYRTTAESSVYVHREHREKGVGKALLNALIQRALENGFHTLVARIAGANEASIGLHELCGYGLVGVEREVGRKFGKWIDCAVYQKLL